jgi:hypothetical protein
VSVTVEVLVGTRPREQLHEFKRHGVTDEALLNEPSRPFKPRTCGRLVLVSLGWFSHTVRFLPELRLIVERMPMTVRNLKLYFLLQNFNVLFTDFEQSHVEGIAGKVVRKRDKLEFWFTEMTRINHLNINDNARSTQV